MTYDDMPELFRSCLTPYYPFGKAFVDIRDPVLWHSTMAMMGISRGATPQQRNNYYHAGVIISQGNYCHLKNLLQLLEKDYGQANLL